MKVLLAIVALTMMLLPLSTGHQDGGDLVNAVIGNITPASHYPNEQARIRAHLLAVAERLRATDTSQLSTAQRVARARNITRLVEYADAGRFPHNHASMPGRAPNFMDNDGNVCAVGYLLEQDKGLAAVREIARDHQFEYVPYIDSPALLAWQKTSGLEPVELAMIQPTYGGHDDNVAQFDDGFSNEDVVMLSLVVTDIVSSIVNFTYVVDSRGNAVWGAIGVFAGMSSILFDHSHDDAPNYLTAGGIMAGAFGATSFAMTVWSNDKDKRVSIAPVVREGLGHASQCGVQAQLSF